ncbi:hypothetical protein [Streptomyces cinereoruber]|uniref:hypothetical protein n=1 Tax=Streptomyces cinereoruber TaxID=67260 RepID=UPI003640D705
MAGIDHGDLDPKLLADIEDLYDSLDPLDLLDDVLASPFSDAAAKAYEQLVTRDWDGLDGLDPLLVDDLEHMYAGLNRMTFLNDIADAPNPQAAEKAFGEMIPGEWPGADGGEQA